VTVRPVSAPPAPVDATQQPTRRPAHRRRPHVIGEILVVVLLVKVYDMIRSLAAARAAPAQRHGAGILSIERLLHLDWEAAANRWLTSHPPLSLAAAYWYEAAHLLVTLSVLVWCYVARPDLYRPMRNALAITNVVGMTVFYLFPVMPPRLLPGGGYTDSVADAGFGTTHGGPVPADQYAAMPSLHLAWAVWTACLAAALLAGRRGRAWCYLYPLTTAIVVVVTANHFILDVVAGTAVGLGSIAAARAVPLVSIPLVQRIRRYRNSAGTNTLGSSGTQTVTSRYPTTAVTAVAGEIPTAVRPPSRVMSSAPVPPGDGTAADTDEAIR
jgi:hypothetical protein